MKYKSRRIIAVMMALIMAFTFYGGASIAFADDAAPAADPIVADAPVADAPATDAPAADAPADNPADAPADQPAADPADEPAADPVDEPAADPVDEPTDEPVDEPTDEPIVDEPEVELADPIPAGELAIKSVEVLTSPEFQAIYRQSLYQEGDKWYTTEDTLNLRDPRIFTFEFSVSADAVGADADAYLETVDLQFGGFDLEKWATDNKSARGSANTFRGSKYPIFTVIGKEIVPNSDGGYNVVIQMQTDNPWAAKTGSTNVPYANYGGGRQLNQFSDGQSSDNRWWWQVGPAYKGLGEYDMTAIAGETEVASRVMDLQQYDGGNSWIQLNEFAQSLIKAITGSELSKDKLDSQITGTVAKGYVALDADGNFVKGTKADNVWVEVAVLGYGLTDNYLPENAGFNNYSRYNAIWNIVVAQDESTVDTYLNETVPTMNTDPYSLIEKYKDCDPEDIDMVNVFYQNNVHPDEISGTDTEVKLVYDLIDGGKAGKKIDYYTWTEDDMEFRYRDPAPGYTRNTTGHQVKGGYKGIFLDQDARTKKQFDTKEALDNLIFVSTICSNPDGKAGMRRTNRYAFDLNRDAVFSTMPETIALMKDIMKWDPIIENEWHGYVQQMLIEPCTAPHDPAFDCDLLYNNMRNLTYAAGMAVTANTGYSNFLVPWDHYDGGDWDDGGTIYSPMFAELLGCYGYTIEFPDANSDSFDAGNVINYAQIDELLHGHTDFYGGNRLNGPLEDVNGVMRDSQEVDIIDEDMKQNAILAKLETKVRGLENIDSMAADKYFIDKKNGVDKVVGRARPTDDEGNELSFFADYIVIPKGDLQYNFAEGIKGINQMIGWNIDVEKLTEDVEYDGKIIEAGSYVIPMNQAYRNVVFEVMSKGYDATGFASMYADIYCNVPDVRGFDSIQVYGKGLFDGKTEPQTELINKVAEIQGEKGDYITFKSQSTDAVRFVNHLFANGADVWMLTKDIDGAAKSDYVINAKDLALLDTLEDNPVIGIVGCQIEGEYLAELPECAFPLVDPVINFNTTRTAQNGGTLWYLLDDYLGFNSLKGYNGGTALRDGANVIIANNVNANSFQNSWVDAIKKGDAGVVFIRNAAGLSKLGVSGVTSTNAFSDVAIYGEYNGDSLYTRNYGTTNTYYARGYAYSNLPKDAKILFKSYENGEDAFIGGFQNTKGIKDTFGDRVTMFATTLYGDDFAKPVDAVVIGQQMDYRSHYQKLLPILATALYAGAAGIVDFDTPADLAPDLQFSLSEDAPKEFYIPVEGVTKDELQAAIDEGKVTLSLDRDAEKPYPNDQYEEDMFPNQKAGGELSTWKASNGRNDIFTNIACEAVEAGGEVCLKVNLDFSCYFYSGNNKDYSAPHANGGSYLDVCGYFDMNALCDGQAIGSIPAKVVPYYDFHTMDEVYEEIDAIEMSNFYHDRFVKQYSMGKSTAGRDMPYLIIAKDQEKVDKWLEYTELVETDPEAALAGIEAGQFDDLAIPVLYSNIHSNEVAAVDGILDFAWKLVKNDKINYKYFEDFTWAGKQQLSKEMGEIGKAGSLAVPDLVADTATYLGYLRDGNSRSGKVDIEKYYQISDNVYDIDEVLDDIFFVIVPEENVDGRAQDTRVASNGFDLNRDNSFQVTNETANMQHLIGTYNPVSHIEFHGRVTSFQCEPCDPPHEPNFEYDILARHLMTGGEAAGICAVANNPTYNSYVIPQRDYLEYTGNGDETYWADPWDDMSTSYTPQYAMLHGAAAYTIELPAYSDDSVQLVSFAILGNSAYVAKEKKGYMEAQAEIYKRGVENYNSDAFDEVGQWLCDQYDVEGAEMDIFRPEYKGEGENGNFYPEAYIIPMDAANQKNLAAAYDMAKYLARNDVKVYPATKAFTIDGVSYPAGTFIVPMYQAKRSVANGVLNNGTLINSWTVLYSEGITAFNKTRGFDMAVTAKPADYAVLQGAMGDAIAFADVDGTKAPSQLEGSGDQVIIKNVSEDSTAAVNELVKAGKMVGMINEGEYKGDFVTKAENFDAVKDTYTLTGIAFDSEGTDVTAQIIAPAKVFILGRAAENTSGYRYTSRVGAATYNYDRWAMDIMNFDTVTDVADATIVLGGSSLANNSPELAAVKAGTPFITYTSAGANNANRVVSGTTRTGLSGAMDCLAYVEYPEETMVNVTYINEGDDIMYGYNAGYFSAIPEGATPLVKVANKTPLEGFIPTQTAARKAAFETYLDGGILGYEYTDGTVDMAVFSQTLTNKVHQRDEYQYISNFIFSRSLFGDYFTNTEEAVIDLQKALEEANEAIAEAQAEAEAAQAEAEAAQAAAEAAQAAADEANAKADEAQAALDEALAKQEADEAAIAELQAAVEATKADAEAAQAAADTAQAAADAAQAAQAAAEAKVADLEAAVAAAQAAADAANIKADEAQAALDETKAADKDAIDALKKEITALKKQIAKGRTITGLKVTVKKRKATVKFKKTPGASGYQIQYKLKTAKKWKNLKKATTKLKATTKKLKKGKKYTFRVRCYTKIDGKKVYGQWSAVKTKKIPKKG